MNIRDEMKKLIKKQNHVSHDTKKTKYEQINRFADFLKEKNIRNNAVKDIKGKTIQAYVNEQKSKGKSIRTIQNELATIRTVLRESGRTEFADSEPISNKALGASGASRAGTNVAMSYNDFKAATDALEARGSHAEAAALGLMYYCGLRAKESVMSSQNISDWKRQIEKTGKISVIHGSKGNRPRDVRINNVEAALEVIEKASSIINQNGGHLVTGHDNTLQSARDRLRNELTAVLKETIFSAHSARYAFAQNQVDFYKDQGFSSSEAFSQASQDLGHGGERWRYIKHVYDQR